MQNMLLKPGRLLNNCCIERKRLVLVGCARKWSSAVSFSFIPRFAESKQRLHLTNTSRPHNVNTTLYIHSAVPRTFPAQAFTRTLGVQSERTMKYVLVTGGVVSGLGKGVTASSIGVVLKACGLRVTSIKIGSSLSLSLSLHSLCFFFISYFCFYRWLGI